jgi:hypothetical protein
MPLGEGLWKGTSKLRPYRQDFLDVRDGQAMSYVVVEENGMPAMLALRLKIAEKRSLKSKRWSHETGLKAPFSKSRTSRLPGPH